MRGKIVGADATRSLACLAVFAYHLGQMASGAKWPPPIAACLRLSEYGKFGVCVFFVLSGFLLGKPFWHSLDERAELPSLKKYFLRRIARIVPATWVCMIVSFFVARWFLFPVRAGHELLRLGAGMMFVSDWSWITFFPVDANGPLWSLSLEASSYLLLVLGFAAITHLFRTAISGWRGRALWLLIIAATIVAHAATTNLLKHGPEMTGFQYGLLGGARSWFPQYNAFGFFGMFAIGTLAAGLSTLHTTAPNRKLPVQEFVWLTAGFGVVAILTISLRLLSFAMPPFDFPILPFFIAAFLLLAPFSPGRHVFENRAITFVADISFGIYVWHDLLISVFAQILPHRMEAHDRVYAICGMATTTTFILAYLSFRFFERPIMAVAHSFHFGRSQTIDDSDRAAAVASRQYGETAT